MIFTIGHSTRAIDELIALLRAHGVTQLADIRTVPKSRRHPQFAREALQQSLPASGIAYRHVPGLGGLRKPRKDSINSAWRNDSFRGYADYMQSPAFEGALEELIEWAGERASTANDATDALDETGGREPFVSGVVDSASRGAPRAPATAIMCAEAVWWRCHRQLVADALVARGLRVAHITSDAPPSPHRLTEFARIDAAGRVSYPGLTGL